MDIIIEDSGCHNSCFISQRDDDYHIPTTSVKFMFYYHSMLAYNSYCCCEQGCSFINLKIVYTPDIVAERKAEVSQFMFLFTFFAHATLLLYLKLKCGLYTRIILRVSVSLLLQLQFLSMNK